MVRLRHTWRASYVVWRTWIQERGCDLLRFTHDSRVVAEFVENRLLRSCRKVVWYCLQKKDTFKLSFRPHSLSRPKFREHCRPLTCACVPTLFRIGCGLPTYSGESQKSQYNIGFQPTVIITATTGWRSTWIASSTPGWTAPCGRRSNSQRERTTTSRVGMRVSTAEPTMVR